MRAKTKLARLCSILLTLVLLVGLLPTVALAADTTADFTSGGGTAALTLLNTAKTDGAADSEWNNTTKTLTLNGVDFTTTAATAVKLPDDAKIVLNGENTITGGDSSVGTCYGIYGVGSLTIQGSGTLTVNIGDSSVGTCYGICAMGSLTIQGSGTLTVNGGDAEESSYGIYAYPGGVTIDGGIVTAKGGNSTNYISCGIVANNGDVTISGSADVIATGGDGTHSYGIGAKEMSISGGTVKAKGGTAVNNSNGIYAYGGGVTISGGANVTATGGDGRYSYGIVAGNGSVGISNTAQVTATAGTATGGNNNARSYGIYAGDGVTINGGADVDATGGTATGSMYYAQSYGIYAGSGSVGISGASDVTATGGTATGSTYEQSYGIYAGTNVTISGNIVKADGDTADYSYGIYAENGSVDISGGTVTATGGNSSEPEEGNSYGIYAGTNVTIDGTVTAKGGTANYSYGICTMNNDVVISGGTVTAEGGEAFGGSHGICANNKEVSISGGTVTAKGAAATYDSYGIKAGDGVGISGNAQVTATSGTAATGTSDSITANNKTIGGHTITFDANGGSGIGKMQAFTGSTGIDYTLPANGFTAPDGKQFKGWAENADGAVISGTTINVTDDTTLYAIWKVNLAGSVSINGAAKWSSTL